MAEMSRTAVYDMRRSLDQLHQAAGLLESWHTGRCRNVTGMVVYIERSWIEQIPYWGRARWGAHYREALMVRELLCEQARGQWQVTVIEVDG